MLRKLRIALALVCFVLITLLFCGIGAHWWGFLAKLQFLPSCLALNFLSIAIILLLTFVFGRLYCSVICPLGVFQDLVIFLRRQYGKLANKLRINALKRAKKKGVKARVSSVSPLKHYGYRREHRIARYSVLAVTVVSAVCSLQLLLVLLAPYSAYGRMVHTAFDLIGGASVPLALLHFYSNLCLRLDVGQGMVQHCMPGGIGPQPCVALLPFPSRDRLFEVRCLRKVLFQVQGLLH